MTFKNKGDCLSCPNNKETQAFVRSKPDFSDPKIQPQKMAPNNRPQTVEYDITGKVIQI